MNNLDDLRSQVLKHSCALWNDDSTNAAADALFHLLPDASLESTERLIGAISHESDYWTLQIGRATLGLGSRDGGDFATLLELLTLAEAGDDSLAFVLQQPMEERIAAFDQWNDGGRATINGREVPAAVLREAVGDCEHVLSDERCERLKIAPGSTYADAATVRV